MVSTTIQVRGPKRLIRRMYKTARREHDRGMAFLGLFEGASRTRVDGEHALRLSRHGYLPLGAARRELDAVIGRAAEREGIEDVASKVHLDTARKSRWGGLWPF